MDRPKAVTAVFAENVTANTSTPECWLAQYGWTNNFESAATNDADGDGIPAWAEYIADTNPTNALSYFHILNVSKSTGLAMSYPSSASRKYTLYYRTNLAAGCWTNVPSQTGIPGSGGVDTLTDPSPSDAQRSYRVGVSTP